MLGWKGPVSGGDAWHEFRFHGQGTIDELPANVLARALCHRLIDLIPDSALPEAGETLGQMYEFYALEPPAPVDGIETGTPTPVEVGQSYERPTIEIAEE